MTKDSNARGYKKQKTEKHALNRIYCEERWVLSLIERCFDIGMRSQPGSDASIFLARQPRCGASPSAPGAPTIKVKIVSETSQASLISAKFQRQ